MASTTQRVGRRPLPRVLGNQKVNLSYAIIVIMMIGFWSVFTFVAPLLTGVSGVMPSTVPWILLLFGVGATIRILVGGRLADRFPEATLIAGFLCNSSSTARCCWSAPIRWP